MMINVFIVAAGLLALACIFLLIYARKLTRDLKSIQDRLVLLIDDVPFYGEKRSESRDGQKRVMKLQDELAPFIKEEDGKIMLTILSDK